MFYILMNFGAFLKNIVIYSAILGVILIIVGYALGKPKKRTNFHNSGTPDNNPIVHVKYECPVCGYTSVNRDEFDDGACIMCDAI